jgi:hypothetical protein
MSKMIYASHILVGKPGEKYRIESKWILKKGVDSIQLGQDRVQGRVLENTVMNLEVT